MINCLLWLDAVDAEACSLPPPLQELPVSQTGTAQTGRAGWGLEKSAVGSKEKGGCAGQPCSSPAGTPGDPEEGQVGDKHAGRGSTWAQGPLALVQGVLGLDCQGLGCNCLPLLGGIQCPAKRLAATCALHLGLQISPSNPAGSSTCLP